MRRITQTMEYEGNNHGQLTSALRDWHTKHPFQTGIDWQFQYMWADLEDQDAFAFILKYPEYADKFKAV